jgi:hypothetical protein
MLPELTGVVLYRSVETPQVCEEEDFVRAHMGISGYVIRPYEGGTQAHVSYVLQLDPKFPLPPFVTSSVVLDQAMNVARLRAVFEQPASERGPTLSSRGAGGVGRAQTLSEDDVDNI